MIHIRARWSIGVLVVGMVMGVGALASAQVGGYENASPTPTPPGGTAQPCPSATPPVAQGSSTPQETATPSYTIVVPGIASGEAEPTPSPTPQPSPTPTPTVPPAFLQLQASMASAIANYGEPGDYAVAVTDLQTGQTIGVNQNQELQSGCIINLFDLMRAVYGVQRGQFSLGSVDSLIRQTIWASDAYTAHELYGIIGNGDVVAGVRDVADMIHQQLGLQQIVLDHPPAYPEESLGVSTDNLVTAAAMNQALADLYHGTLLTGQYRDYLLEAMTHVKPGLNYLTATLPSGPIVSHKNGFFWDPAGWVDNDTAIVRFQKGGTTYAYAITFISTHVPDKYADITLGQQLVRMAWEYFNAAY